MNEMVNIVTRIICWCDNVLIAKHMEWRIMEYKITQNGLGSGKGLEVARIQEPLQCACMCACVCVCVCVCAMITFYLDSMYRSLRGRAVAVS
jgi:hypothetical protein